MQKYSFDQGARIVVDGKRFRLLNAVQIGGRRHWQAHPIGVGAQPIVACFDLCELEARLANGSLEFDIEQDSPGQPRPVAAHKRLPPSQQRDKAKNYIQFWRAVIEGVVDASFTYGTETVRVFYKTPNRADLARVLNKLGVELGHKFLGDCKSISVSQYYKMRKRYDAGGLGDLTPDYSARGNRTQMHPLVKRAMYEAIEERLDEAGHRHGTARSATFSSIKVQTRLLQKIQQLRIVHPNLESKLKVPSKTTVCKAILQFDHFRVLAAKRGITQAKLAMRRPFGHSKPQACLSETQYDETRFDMYCYLESEGIPLGRPWFSWMVDVYSGGILGFYLGFEPPGDTVFSSVLRHCCLPKSYMLDRYPDIDLPLKLAGVPRLTTFDNSLSAHSRTIELIYGDLDIEWTFCRPKEPYTKPDVESAFGTLNRTLLSDAPGYAPPLGRQISDYDPKKNGLISFERLLMIVHRWVAERHNFPIPSSPYSGSPNERWDEGTKDIPPSYPRAEMDLEAMFGILRDGNVDHRGVRYKNLFYFSDQLQDLRLRKGAKLPVKVKVNPADLSAVFVLDIDRQVWIKCVSLDPETTNGLDLYRHTLIQKRQRELFGKNVSRETYLQARLSFEIDLAGWRREDLGIGINARVARADGVGTHNSARLEADPSCRDAQRDQLSPPDRAVECDSKPLVIPRLDTARLPH